MMNSLSLDRRAYVASGDDILRYSADELFYEHLNLGEKVLWTGKPNLKMRFNSADYFLIPISIFMCGFIGFMVNLIYGWFEGNMPVIPLVFFVVFGVVVINYAFGRFFVKAWRKKRTFYALTNRRALFIYKGRRQIFSEVTLDNIDTISKDVRPNGNGTIKFGDERRSAPFFSDLPVNSGLERFSTYTSTIRFLDIDNVNHVFNMIQEVKKSTHQQ